MTKKKVNRQLDERMRSAINELKGMIKGRYPEATFRLGHDPEDPEVVVLEPTVDVDDRDEAIRKALREAAAGSGQGSVE